MHVFSRVSGANVPVVCILFISYYSGYDFGYLVKVLTAASLPTTEDAFFENLRIWFPSCYDIKFMMRACKSLKGGLQDVADDLGVCPRFSFRLWYLQVSR